MKGFGYDWAGEALWWLWNASHADGDLDARRNMEECEPCAGLTATGPVNIK